MARANDVRSIKIGSQEVRVTPLKNGWLLSAVHNGKTINSFVIPSDGPDVLFAPVKGT